MRLLLCCGALLICGAPVLGAEPPTPEAQRLVTEFWRAEGEVAQQQSQQELLRYTGDVEQLYEWLQSGPDYAAEVPTGVVETVRIGANGTEFPYLTVVPENYDPARAYPLEFYLHGGVGRPEWEPGGGWWRRRDDSQFRDDRILVVPAAWREAFWWQDSQADNVSAILRDLKQTYHIDDNRVTMTGVSDGGTGAWFFAFKQPTPWAAFMPYIGHPGVLRNPNSGGGYRLYFENLQGRPIYMVNGENDRLYPAASLGSFVSILQQQGIEHVFRVIEDGGHDTRWLADETPAIEAFKRDNPRDPLPDSLEWVADRADRYNRLYWLRIDELVEAERPSLLRVRRDGNAIAATVHGVARFTLLLSPAEIDFSEPLVIRVNDRTVHAGFVQQDAETLLDWARRDRDRSMLFTAEFEVEVPEV